MHMEQVQNSRGPKYENPQKLAVAGCPPLSTGGPRAVFTADRLLITRLPENLHYRTLLYASLTVLAPIKLGKNFFGCFNNAASETILSTGQCAILQKTSQKPQKNKVEPVAHAKGNACHHASPVGGMPVAKWVLRIASTVPVAEC